jgi:hypothetical protein
VCLAAPKPEFWVLNRYSGVVVADVPNPEMNRIHHGVMRWTIRVTLPAVYRYFNDAQEFAVYSTIS